MLINKCTSVEKKMINIKLILMTSIFPKNIFKGRFSFKKDTNVTEVGEYLHKYSLDKLPQLFNVLKRKSKFSRFPHPLPIREVGRFISEHYFRHKVFTSNH